jgi:hypothetical protein
VNADMDMGTGHLLRIETASGNVAGCQSFYWSIAICQRILVAYELSSLSKYV